METVFGMFSFQLRRMNCKIFKQHIDFAHIHCLWEWQSHCDKLAWSRREEWICNINVLLDLDKSLTLVHVIHHSCQLGDNITARSYVAITTAECCVTAVYREYVALLKLSWWLSNSLKSMAVCSWLLIRRIYCLTRNHETVTPPTAHRCF